MFNLNNFIDFYSVTVFCLIKEFLAGNSQFIFKSGLKNSSGVGLFDQWDPGPATMMKEILKNTLIKLHSMKVSWSAYELFS